MSDHRPVFSQFMLKFDLYGEEESSKHNLPESMPLITANPFDAIFDKFQQDQTPTQNTVNNTGINNKTVTNATGTNLVANRRQSVAKARRMSKVELKTDYEMRKTNKEIAVVKTRACIIF